MKSHILKYGSFLLFFSSKRAYISLKGTIFVSRTKALCIVEHLLAYPGEGAGYFRKTNLMLDLIMNSASGSYSTNLKVSTGL